MVNDLSFSNDKGTSLPNSNTYYWACEINLATQDILWTEYERNSKEFSATTNVFPDDIIFYTEELTSSNSARTDLSLGIGSTIQSTVHLAGRTTHVVIYLSEKPTEGNPDIILSDVIKKTKNMLQKIRNLQGTITLTGIHTNNEMTPDEINASIFDVFLNTGKSR